MRGPGVWGWVRDPAPNNQLKIPKINMHKNNKTTAKRGGDIENNN